MNYEFSLDGKKVAGLVTGLCMLGVLAFIGGLLVGASMSPPGTAAVAASSGSAKTTPSGGGKAASELSRNPLAQQGMTALQKSNPALGQAARIAMPLAGGGGSGAATGGAVNQGIAALAKSSPELAKATSNPLAKQGINTLVKGGTGKRPGAQSPGPGGAGAAAGGAAAAGAAESAGGSPQAKATSGPKSATDTAEKPGGAPEKASDTPGAGTKPPPGASEKAGANPPNDPAAQKGGEAAGSGASGAPGVAAKADGASDAGGGNDPPKADEVGKRFSVQVGSFLVEKNARNLVADLEGWGYPAFVFETKDAKGRVWYAVRFGDYEDKKQATQAASEFMKKAKRAAVVSVQDAL